MESLGESILNIEEMHDTYLSNFKTLSKEDMYMYLNEDKPEDLSKREKIDSTDKSTNMKNNHMNTVETNTMSETSHTADKSTITKKKMGKKAIEYSYLIGIHCLYFP